MSSPGPPSPVSCSLCQMVRYSSASFSDNGTYNKCSANVEQDPNIASQALLAGAEWPNTPSTHILANIAANLSLIAPTQPRIQDGFIIPRKHRSKPALRPPPVNVAN